MEQTTESPQAPRRLTRITDGRIVAGVANGIGVYFDIDPWFVRAAFILLTFFGGTGILLYIVGIVLMPNEYDPPGETPIERAFTGHPRRGPLGLIVLLFVLFVIFAGHNNGFGHHIFFPLPFLLIAAGLFLFRDRWRGYSGVSAGSQSWRAPQDSAFTSGATQTPAAESGAADTAATVTAQIPTPITTSAYGARATYARRPRRERSPLGMLTFGLAILALGVTIALDQSGTLHLHIQQVLAIPMITLGLGLLVGAIYGRARLLIIPALLLLPFMVAAHIADVPLGGNVGSAVYEPASAAEIQSTYSHGAGRMIVNLSKIATPETRTVNIEQGAGEIVVIVPASVPVSVDASGGAGVIDLFGNARNGISPHQSEGSGGLHLVIRNGFGRTFISNDPYAPEAN